MLLGLMIAFDGAKFILVGGPGIINWNSFIHPAWVITAFATISLISYFLRPWMTYSAFFVYLFIFALSLLNQYLQFTPVLTYNCMLFNLVFTSIYFFLLEKHQEHDFSKLD